MGVGQRVYSSNHSILNLKLLQDRTHIPLDRESSVFVQIEVSPDQTTKIKQRDHHICLVIDCSGSMQPFGGTIPLVLAGKSTMLGEDKMGQAKSAAINLVRKLPSSDLVSIVQFNSTAKEILEPKPAFERKYIEGIINSIDTGGATAMHEGISVAFSRTIARVQQRSPDVINKMILITDGDPTAGPTDDDDFEQLAKEVRNGGVSLDTIGVGEEYGQNEEHGQLLRKIAECGGGGWEHASDPGQLTKIVETKYTEMAKTVITNPTLQLTLLNAAELDEMYTVKPTINRIENLQRNGNTISIGLKDILKDEEQAIVLQMTIPPGNGTNLPLLRSAILEDNTEIASKAIEISHSSDKLLCKRLNESVFWAFYSMKGTVLRRDAIDGDKSAGEEADRITKLLPNPDEDWDKLGQETVTKLRKISGKDTDTISKSNKTKLKHDTTFIDDHDNDTNGDKQ